MAGGMNVADILNLRNSSPSFGVGTGAGTSTRPPKPVQPTSDATPSSPPEAPILEKTKKRKKTKTSKSSPLKLSKVPTSSGTSLFAEDASVDGVVDVFLSEEDKTYLSSLDKSSKVAMGIRSIIRGAALFKSFENQSEETCVELEKSKMEATLQKKQYEDLLAKLRQVESELGQAQDAARAAEAKATASEEKLKQKLRLSEEGRKKALGEVKVLEDNLSLAQAKYQELAIGAANSLEQVFMNAKAQAGVLAPDIDFGSMLIDGHVVDGKIEKIPPTIPPEAQMAASGEEVQSEMGATQK